MQCPELPPLLNGTITYGLDFTPDFDSGTLATHFCDFGFRLVGPLSRVCLNTGMWSLQPPVCERKIYKYNRLCMGKQIPLWVQN